MSGDGPSASEQLRVHARQWAVEALRMVSVNLPHLSGLASRIWIEADARVPSAGVFASGRLLVNPEWFTRLERADAAFVLAHELMHLAFRTHQRADEKQVEAYNIAHDYVINDMLSEALDRPVPANGLVWPGARHLSLEDVVRSVLTGNDQGNASSRRTPNPLADALRRAGLTSSPEQGGIDLDVLSDAQEREWFPSMTRKEQEQRRGEITQASARAASLERLGRETQRLFDDQSGSGGDESGGEVTLESALRGLYAPPWQAALQRWLEAVAPGPRTYTRPSRRGADRTDVVLPGRRREGWTLNIVLDTSGSMSGTFRLVLGAIASFCESANVTDVRILQCDVDITSDEIVAIDHLHDFYIAGLGGSDMTPAMERLAADPEVEAAIVLTDGYIDYPENFMPYDVLWAVTTDYEFEPTYGQVVRLAELM